MDYSPPGSSVHGILQEKIPEWVAMPSSKGSPGARHLTWVSCLLHWRSGSLPLAPPGKHCVIISRDESGFFLWGFSIGLSQQRMIPGHLGEKKWLTQHRCFIRWAKGLGNREIIHFKMSCSSIHCIGLLVFSTNFNLSPHLYLSHDYKDCKRQSKEEGICPTWLECSFESLFSGGSSLLSSQFNMSLKL